MRTCTNGHQSKDSAARFCITCGVALAAVAPQQPTPLNAPPQNPAQNQPPQGLSRVNNPQYPATGGNPATPNVNQPTPNFNQQPQQFNQQPPQLNQPPMPVQYYPQQGQNLNQYPQNQQPYLQNPAQYGQNGAPYQQNGAPYPQQWQPQPMPQAPVYYQPPPSCRTCGGDGRGLAEKLLVCPECRWLRPLAPGYAIDCAAFQWAEDGKAMSALRAITPLNSAAQGISNKVGRRWIEAAFNGVMLSEKQLPDVYFPAVRAARILGMTHMPDVYVSGDCLWDCHTYGSDKSAFIIIGSALATNFRGLDLLFVLAREMGHARAGHALWKSVIRFLVGEQSHRRGMFSNGILGVLNPSALLEGAIEMPLLAWARQAEITADRAGLLTVGSEEVARRVLLTWSLKSAFLYKRINVNAWLEQQAASDTDVVRLSELATSSTPYITRRLALMTQFAKSPELDRWRQIVNTYAPLPQPQAKTPAPQSAPTKPEQKTTAAASQTPKKEQLQPSDEIKMKCAGCGAPMRVPRKAFAGKEQIGVRCPNPKCGKIATLKIKKNPAPAAREEKPDRKSVV